MTKSKSNFWETTSWVFYIKYGLLGLLCLIVLAIIIRILLLFTSAIKACCNSIIPVRANRREARRENDYSDDENALPLMHIGTAPVAAIITERSKNICTGHHTKMNIKEDKYYWKVHCLIPILYPELTI